MQDAAVLGVNEAVPPRPPQTIDNTRSVTLPLIRKQAKPDYRDVKEAGEVKFIIRNS